MNILNNNEYIDVDRLMKICEDKEGNLDIFKLDMYKMILGRFFDEYEIGEDDSENKLLNKSEERTEAYVVVKNTLKKYKILK